MRAKYLICVEWARCSFCFIVDTQQLIYIWFFFPLLCTLFSVRMIFTINIMLRYIKQPIYSSNHCFTEYVTLSLDLIWMAYYCFEIVANIWLKWFPSDLFQKCSLTFSIMMLVWQRGKPSSCQRKNILLYTFFAGISTYFSYLFWVDFWLNIWFEFLTNFYCALRIQHPDLYRLLSIWFNFRVAYF